jgi:hypothetical protein
MIRSSPSFRCFLAVLVAPFIAMCVSPARAAAQERESALVVTVTTENGSIVLPGASVRVTSITGHTIATDVSDGQGLVRLDTLAPGVYQISAMLAGFQETRTTVKVEAQKPAQATLDLRLAGLTEEVNVIGNAETAPPSVGGGLSTRGVLESRVVEQLPVRDHSVLSALKLLAGIVDGPGGVSIKGGRTNQSGLQIGMTAQTDPSTGQPLFRLPADAIDTVEVLPNPYAVEFGRFSSGLTLINTKRGGDVWRVALNAPDVSFRTARGAPWHVTGLESFGPRIGLGGPLVKDRLFLEESAQLRYDVSEVWSRPPDETKTSKWLSNFTRLDANVSPKLSLVGNVNVFRSLADNVTLGTFNGPAVTPDEGDHFTSGSIAAHSTLSNKLVFESTLQASALTVDVAGHGNDPMQLIPSGNAGNFFNHQNRSTTTMQWVEAMTGSFDWGGISHLFKAGLDVMHTELTGSSDSGPVSILRENGTLARSLSFSGPVWQQYTSTDVALFAQDRVQPLPRLLLEFGGRIDRDGVLEQINATPRVGAVLLLTPQGTAAIRAGYGLFFERTPSIAGAFGELDASTEVRYAADGITPLGPPLLYQHVISSDLAVARSATWNVQYDQRLTRSFSIRAAALNRKGTNELVVNPIQGAAAPGSNVIPPARGLAELQLSSAGTSAYSEGEITLRYAPSRQLELSGTYARSSAWANLNAYTAFFDNIRWPVIGQDQYAPTASSVPNRLIAHTRTIFANRVLVSSILEIHSGFPYSVVNDMLDWVGPRNQRFYFPTFAMLDLDVEHKFTFIKGKPWIGIRAFNALNRFSPTEVQSNLSSLAFGSFYNSYGRQLRLQIRFEQ